MKELTKEQMEIVKGEHPSWFNEDGAGEWYIKPINGSIQFNIKDGKGYGWCLAHGWVDDARWFQNDRDNEFREATPEEVKSALIAEAKRRYKVGDRLSKIYEDYAKCENRCFGEREFAIEDGKLYMQNDISYYDYCIFYNGQWASVIPQDNPSLQDDIKALKDRWPDINFTVIAEGKK